jgi:acetyltransferase-like isoleucine patch superfamily enzyme
LTLRKGLTRLYSLVQRRALLACGPNFQIGFPATLENPRAIVVGSNVWIKEHAWLNCAAGPSGRPLLTIGSGSYLGRFAHINVKVGVMIEEDVLISDRVFITDYHHGFADAEAPIISQPLSGGQPVRLRRGCWIGDGAVIMPGITIGQNAVVGANAVVTRDVPDRAIVGGVPARSIRIRDAEGVGGRVRARTHGA